MLIQWSASSSLPVRRCGAVTALGAPQLSARLPWGLCQGPGSACAAVSAHEDLLEAPRVYLGASSVLASSQMQFFPLNPMWFRDLALVKSEGFCLLSTGCITFLPSWLQQRQGVKLEGKVSWWEQEGMDGVLSWWHDSTGFAPLPTGRCIKQTLANVVG